MIEAPETGVFMHKLTRRHPQITCVSSGPILTLLAAVGLSGCATSQVRTSGDWQASAVRGQAFSTVLVIGVSPNRNQRCTFEQRVASRINTGSTVAVTSCNLLTKEEELTRANIEALVAAGKIDGVVATLLVDRSWDAEHGGGRDTRGSASYKATDSGYYSGYYGVYGVPVIYGEFQNAPPITTMQGEVHVTTKAFDTKGATLIYTMDTTAKGFESSDVGLSQIASGIVDQLRRDGLVH
jgi:hypothetical protein